MRQEKILFEKVLQRVNLFLKFTGIHINNEDTNRTVIGRLRNRWFYCMNFLWLNTDVFGEIIYFIEGVSTQMSIEKITYIIPCVTLCLLGNLKSYYFINYAHHVNNIVDALRTLQAIERRSEKGNRQIENELIKIRLPFLNTATKILLICCTIGLTAFAIGPLVIAVTNYLGSGEIKLILPFLVLYPFDAFDIRFWPFVYIHQLWSAWIAVFTVYGPDCFYYTCCTFIHIQFRSLQYDIQNIGGGSSHCGGNGVNNAFQIDFVNLVKRHKELIRCVNMLEIIYSKSTLFNVVSSSFIICVTGFNIMAIDDLPLMAPFTAFLSLGLLQIFFFCYYGDMINVASAEVSDAVYNSQWYKLNASAMRDYLFVLIRAQKACKLTAYGFNDINLKAFARILSTAWSYFALLTTMYRE